MKKSDKKSVNINDMMDDINHLLEFVNDLNQKNFDLKINLP